jgi:Ca2+-binding RTX toxin-like protein
VSARARLLIFSAIALFALPACAQAATVSIEPDGTLLVTADAGKDSYFLVATESAALLGTDSVYVASVDAYGKQGETIAIPPECSLYGIDGHAVYCPDAGVTRVRVEAGDGADDVRAQNGRGAQIPIDVIGGAGKDRLSINWACLNCTADGGAGNDKIAMCPCDGTANGGDGNDRISARFPYALPATGSTLGTTMNGGAANDRLDGSDNEDTIDGGPGNDLIDGHKRADTLLGSEGKDRIIATDGSLGDDTVDCGTNSDGSRELDYARIDGNLSGLQDSTTNCEHVAVRLP